MSSLSNNFRLNELKTQEVQKDTITKVQQLINGVAVDLLKSQSCEENYLAVTSSLAILQSVATLITDRDESTHETTKCTHEGMDFKHEATKFTHEAMKCMRGFLEGKSDLIGNEVSILHNIWLGKEMRLERKVHNLLASHYSCETKTLPLTNTEVNVSKLKNKLGKLDKAKRHTDEFQSAVFNDISEQDILLTSAVYIQMTFREPFMEQLTTKGTFHISTQEKVEIDLMVHRCGLVCLQHDKINAEVLQLPLTAHNMSMLVFLPHEKTINGMVTISRNLTPEIFKTLVANLAETKPKPIYITLPKFSLKISGLLSRDPFDKDINVSQSEGNPSCKIFHTTTLALNEYGINTTTERATNQSQATIAGPAMHDGIKWTNFTATSPFLFMLVDIEHKLIFLTGKVSRPEQASQGKRKYGLKENRKCCSCI